MFVNSATLPDHRSCYRDVKNKLKKIRQKNLDYPIDLFIGVHFMCVSSIHQNIWDEYIATKNKK